jgi:hypothetical protein
MEIKLLSFPYLQISMDTTLILRIKDYISITGSMMDLFDIKGTIKNSFLL